MWVTEWANPTSSATTYKSGSSGFEAERAWKRFLRYMRNLHSLSRGTGTKNKQQYGEVAELAEGARLLSECTG